VARKATFPLWLALAHAPVRSNRGRLLIASLGPFCAQRVRVVLPVVPVGASAV